MPSREDAIRLLTAAGEAAAAEHVRTWRNRDGGTGGWDANLKSAYPSVRTLLWQDTLAARAAGRGDGPGRPHPPPLTADHVPLERRVQTAFDAYVMIDWSASSTPNRGSDSVWWACLEWTADWARVDCENFSTRAEVVEHVRSELGGRLREHRTLVGLDFPFGFPAGFAAALGHTGPPGERWRFVWQRLCELIVDAKDNANNRLAVAAALNAELSGGFGPFYGRPARVPGNVERTLSATQSGHFNYPLATLAGHALARQRLADARAGTTSSPWFVFGGGNSVGGQALMGIPRVRELRRAFSDARVWPFETGAALPERAEARVVFAEIYPSLFHTRVMDSLDVHDKLQVEAAVKHFATTDGAGKLESLFTAPPSDSAVLGEEGWVLGVE